MAAFVSPASSQLTTLVQSIAVDRGPIPLPRQRPKRPWLPVRRKYKSGCDWAKWGCSAS